jgi:hypothetical protein
MKTREQNLRGERKKRCSGSWSAQRHERTTLSQWQMYQMILCMIVVVRQLQPYFASLSPSRRLQRAFSPVPSVAEQHVFHAPFSVVDAPIPPWRVVAHAHGCAPGTDRATTLSSGGDCRLGERTHRLHVVSLHGA